MKEEETEEKGGRGGVKGRGGYGREEIERGVGERRNEVDGSGRK